MKDIKITIDTSDVERAEKCFESLRLAALKATEAMKEFSRVTGKSMFPQFLRIKTGDYVVVGGDRLKVIGVDDVSFAISGPMWFHKTTGQSYVGGFQAYPCY